MKAIERWKSIVFLIPILFITGAMIPHAIHISVMDISYPVESYGLRVNYKIFTDDLEAGIRASSGEIIALQDGISRDESVRIKAYLQERCQIETSQALSWEIESYENQSDATLIQLRAAFTGSISQLHISNSLLIDLFPTQRNIVRLRIGERQQLLSLSAKKQKGTFRLP